MAIRYVWRYRWMFFVGECLCMCVCARKYTLFICIWAEHDMNCTVTHHFDEQVTYSVMATVVNKVVTRALSLMKSKQFLRVQQKNWLPFSLSFRQNVLLMLLVLTVGKAAKFWIHTYAVSIAILGRTDKNKNSKQKEIENLLFFRANKRAPKSYVNFVLALATLRFHLPRKRVTHCRFIVYSRTLFASSLHRFACS